MAKKIQWDQKNWTKKSAQMTATINELGPLRKEWECYLGTNARGFRSIRQVSTIANINHRVLSKAINAGVAPESVRSALAAINIPEHLIPLTTCTRTLAATVFELQKILNQRPRI